MTIESAAANNRLSITRLNNDVNGNPRYAIHWLALLENEALSQWDKSEVESKGVWSGNIQNGLTYDIACYIAKQASFKRYHNKSFGGGLSFSSYNVSSDLSHLDTVCERFVVDNTDNDCLTQHVLLQANQQHLDECGHKTLYACIKAEKQVKRLSLSIVEDWLRGLPSACSLPYMDNEQEAMCKACGLVGWNGDMYWRYAAKVLLACKG